MTNPAQSKQQSFWRILQNCFPFASWAQSSGPGVKLDDKEDDEHQALLPAAASQDRPYPSRMPAGSWFLVTNKAIVKGLTADAALFAMIHTLFSLSGSTSSSHSDSDSSVTPIAMLCHILAFTMFLWTFLTRFFSERRPSETSARLKGTWPKSEMDAVALDRRTETDGEHKLRALGLMREFRFVRVAQVLSNLAMIQDGAGAFWGALSLTDRFFNTGSLSGWMAAIAPGLALPLVVAPSVMMLKRYRLNREAISGNIATLILFIKNQLRDAAGHDCRGRFPHFKLLLVALSSIGFYFTNYAILQYGLGLLVVAFEHVFGISPPPENQMDQWISALSLLISAMNIPMSAGNCSAILFADKKIDEVCSLHNRYPVQVRSAALFTIPAFLSQYGLTYLGIYDVLKLIGQAHFVQYGPTALMPWFVQVPSGVLVLALMVAQTLPTQVFDISNILKPWVACEEAGENAKQLITKALRGELAQNSSAQVLSELFKHNPGLALQVCDNGAMVVRRVLDCKRDTIGELQRFFSQVDLKENGITVAEDKAVTLSPQRATEFVSYLQSNVSSSSQC